MKIFIAAFVFAGFSVVHIWGTDTTDSGVSTLISAIPNKLQTNTGKLDVIVDNLPNTTDHFECVFSILGKTFITTATRKSSSGVTCPTPSTESLSSSIYPGQNYFTTKLVVRMADIVTTNVTFYDCNTYSSCTQCVSSPFPCNWCLERHRCTHDTAENCRNDIIVTGVNRVPPNDLPGPRSGPTFCPAISMFGGDSSKILVASGMTKSINVKASLIGQLAQTRFVCHFNVEGEIRTASAHLLGDTIYCDPMEFIYTSKAPNITVPVNVIWEGLRPLANPNKLHIVVYHCRHTADNAETCMTLAEEYGCGWCRSSKSCEVRDHQCKKDSAV